MRRHRKAAARRIASALGLLLALSATSLAVTPDEVLQDPKLEARARALSQNLRCLVCQNQSIDDSNAELARDLRVLLRERLTAGDTDEQAIGFMVARYGNFVLLKPPLQGDTLLLWFGPALLLGGAAIAFGLYLRRKGAADTGASAPPLAAEEQERIKAILSERRPA
jgi:cytochrome c-type biogenesis protein CcmH